MNLKRILKLLGAFLMSQGVSVVTQLLVPPIFLHRYPHGVEMYGEWMALTAAVSYLGSLHSGVQTYANNQMTLHYNRGEVTEAKTVQSSALRIMVIMLLVAAGVGGSILFMPIAGWMGLRHITSAAAALTLMLMILRVVVGWFFNFVSNSYLVIGQLHRGLVWQNIQRLTAALALTVLLWARASFPVLALSQLVCVALFAGIVLVEVRIRAPILLPSFRYGDSRHMIAVWKPGAYYMLNAFGAFLCWQGPLLLIQKILGPTAVAVFALSRVIFNMSRQLLIVLSYSIGQEAIHFIARRSWAQLHRIYDLSERAVLLMDSSLTVGALLGCPFLLNVWLHRRGLYEPGVCMLMAMISAIIGIREHKFTFQRLSNRHQRIAKFLTATYTGMLLVTAFFMREWGVQAFLVSWLVAESLICWYVVRENRSIFPAQFRPSLRGLARAAAVTVGAFALAVWPVWHDGTWPLHRVAGVAIAATVTLLVINYFVLGLRELQEVFQKRLRWRFAGR